MEVLSIKDQPDGSAIVELNMTEEENNILVEHAIIDILKKQIKLMESEDKRKCFDCDEEIDSETLAKHPDTEICSECISNE